MTAPRDDGNWAQPGRPPVGRGRRGRAGRFGQREARVRPVAGLRPALAEDVPGAARRRRAVAPGAGRDLEGRLPDVLAEGRRVLRPARRDRPGRGRAARYQPAARGSGQAQHRDPRDLCGRRVVHVHDPARPHAVGLDHLLGVGGGRRDRRPGTGPRTHVRSLRRAGVQARREPDEQPVLGAARSRTSPATWA